MDQIKIGTFIAEKRKEKGMTQNELGEKLGLGYKAISKWETGRSFPDVSLMQPLCKELNISLNELLNGESEGIESDDAVADYMSYQHKKYKSKLIISFIIIILIIITSILLIYFINNYNKFKVYKLNGKGEYFEYQNAVFISSNIDYFYIDGKISALNPEDEELYVNQVCLKATKRLIYCDGVNIKTSRYGSIAIEHYGYDELFPKSVVDDLDNWYIEITFNKDGKEQTDIINLDNTNILRNASFFEHKVLPIAKELTEKEKKEIEIERQKYEETMRSSRDETIELLEQKGFKRLKYYRADGTEIDPDDLDEKERHYSYSKVNKDGSKWKVGVYFGASIIEYTSEDYTVIASNKARYITFDSSEGDEEFHYYYDLIDDEGKCYKGRCPEDFKYMAKEFIMMYKDLFNDILMPAEHSCAPGQECDM